MLGLKDAGVAVDALTLKARFEGAQSPVTAGDIELLAFAVPNSATSATTARIVRDGAWFDNAQDVLYDATAALHAMTARRSPRGRRPSTRSTDRRRDRTRPGYRVPGLVRPRAQGLAAAMGRPHRGDRRRVAPGRADRPRRLVRDGQDVPALQMLRCCRKAGANGSTSTRTRCTARSGPPGPHRDDRHPVPVIEGKRASPPRSETEVIAALQALPYETTATAGWPVEDYCRDMRRHKWDVAAIDTVTNLPCSRVDEWDRACVMLADAAAQAGTHLILVSQLNLERDKGKKPPPVGRDLRNTGAWYQRARVVMFVHRDQQVIETRATAR
jgi:hypothetical protein